MSSSYRISLDNWLKELDVKADAVLDIGGSQLPIKGRTKSWDVKKYLIADLPNPHKDSPQPDIEMDLNDSWTPKLIYDLHDRQWDYIFCLEVFDYIWNPLGAMNVISGILKEGGTACVTFPGFYPHHQPIEDDALLYKEYGIRKLAKASGLTIKQMIPRRPETNALQQFFAAERLRAAKGYDHAVLGWIVELKK